MTLKNQNRLSLLIFLSLLLFCLYWQFIKKDELKANGIIVKGQIQSDVTATKSSVMLFRYVFHYNGKKYESDSPAGVTNPNEFIGKIFPICFSPESGKSKMLITPKHFHTYKLTYPDSLNWVKRYLIKGI